MDVRYIIIVLFFPFLVTSQSKTYQINYQKKSNGKEVLNDDIIQVYVQSNFFLITTQNIESNKANFPFEITEVINDENKIIQFAQLNETKKIFTVDSLSLPKQSFELLNETKKILGYTCKKAKIIINSNTIELWYTNELEVKGAPTIIGANLGLVLQMTRNGNYEITASEIKKTKKKVSQYSKEKKNKEYDLLSYKDLLWKSRFLTTSIFKDEVINFSSDSKSNDSIFRFANGTVILKKIKLPKINSSLSFIDLTEKSNGDAYDRTGSVFLIESKNGNKKTFLEALQKGIANVPAYENGNGKKYQGIVANDNYEPLIELMRFFTPFGIHQYNHIQLKDKEWEDQVYYRQEVTDVLMPFSEKEVYVGVFIGNYDKGGHKISLNLSYHKADGSSQNIVQSLFSLFNTTNVLEMAGQEYGTLFNSNKGLEVSFTLAKDIKNAKLRYITTGHGGWENGDEYLPKKNTIYLDDVQVFYFTPWRQDCGTYRLYNPASGNFINGLSSSDYSRSNWCPGTVTNPIYIELGDLKAGNHKIKITIPQGAVEGNSFSSWNVSGILFGE
ncbi:GLPGLI family protein [Flavobacterium terrae]|uniref:GLPGLI family protein n=1 Tax=Flavobacterium terrae TaxID=415425 RepID=A0A1M6FPE5_9FLAO|nr:GLPGLI family protein [Flavobacterium terrae]SHI99628.1 GLPGLI family protein [Flavobacterium terrae]